jgi:hypothetical protein
MVCIVAFLFRPRAAKAVFFAAQLGLLILVCSPLAQGQDQAEEEQGGDDVPVQPASAVLQPTPLLEPRINVAEDARAAGDSAAANRLRVPPSSTDAANRGTANRPTFTRWILSGRLPCAGMSGYSPLPSHGVATQSFWI